MDNKFYVSYEAARLLKEKGYNNYSIVYDCSVKGSILLNQQPMYGEWAGDKDVYPCPTKAEAIDWLESKGIVAEAFYTSHHWFFSIIDFNVKQKIFADEYYSTRLEAEEAAIIKACELL